MSALSDVYAYFWIQGFDCSCEDITSVMKITPSKVRKIGDISHTGKVIKRNLWQLNSPLERGENFIQDYLTQLLDILEPCEEVISELVSKYELGINCVGYYYGSNPGLHLSAELIKRLAALDLSVDFDLYNYAGDKDDL